jgi:hypothetical protein
MGRNKKITALRKAKKARRAAKEHDRRTEIGDVNSLKTVRNHRRGNGARARSKTKCKYSDFAHQLAHNDAAKPYNSHRKRFDVEVIDGLPIYHGYNYE